MRQAFNDGQHIYRILIFFKFWCAYISLSIQRARNDIKWITHKKKSNTDFGFPLLYEGKKGQIRNSFKIIFFPHLYYLMSVFLIDLASKLSNCFKNFTLRRCNQLSQCISSPWCFDFNVSVRFFFSLILSFLNNSVGKKGLPFVNITVYVTCSSLADAETKR